MADGAKKGPFAALRGAAAKPAAAKEETGLGKTRRRLSVVSDNKLVEGLSGLATEDATKATDSSAGDHVITSYAGVSKKGYAPYNPRKKNQDALIMEHHAETGSLLLCVFDGHGEAGDGVAQFFRNQMPPTLFAHPGFVGGVEEVKQAIAESTAFLERNLLRDSSIDTEFSGTTAVMCVIRGKDLIVGNIGDSRISKGTCAASADWKKGAVVATQVSDDHKPFGRVPMVVGTIDYASNSNAAAQHRHATAHWIENIDEAQFMVCFRSAHGDSVPDVMAFNWLAFEHKNPAFWFKQGQPYSVAGRTAGWKTWSAYSHARSASMDGKSVFLNCKVVPFGREFPAIPTVLVTANHVDKSALDWGVRPGLQRSHAAIATYIDEIGTKSFKVCTAESATSAELLYDSGIQWDWLVVGDNADMGTPSIASQVVV